MEELIPIQEYNGKKAVSARLLHEFLESKREFATWIKDRIRKYGFIENQDYEVFDNFVNNPNGGRPLIEYALTIPCAKEISMVEGNEKGRQARKYFIACEEKLIGIVQNSLTPAEALLQNVQILVEQEKRLSTVEEKVKEIEAKTTTRPDYYTAAGYYRRMGISASSNMCKSLGQKASKLCKQRNIPIDDVPDTRWGHVGSYPANILDEVFYQSIN